jgi:hypothetical protein
MPWNPAVLDQRIARIHRLGQKKKVQVFILLAEDSYEQQVASLVKGKRDLFDNVISPDATEDVVGVSKKMLQSIIDDLTGEDQQTEQETATPELSEKLVPTDQEQQAVAQNAEQTSGVEQEIDNKQISSLITKIQTAFSPRIERVLASGGGLLVVVDRVEQNDDRIAQELSETELPVVVIDARTLNSLQRLGASSPVAEAKIIIEEDKQQDDINPLVKIAQNKLHSAEILVNQQCYAGVMDILATTMLTVATYVSDQQQLPTLEKATVWLYSDVLPKQLMTVEQVGAIVRVISLSQNVDVPDVLIEQALSDTQALVAQYVKN